MRHDTSAGALAARKTGIAQARGKIIFLLDDDDALMPDYVQNIMTGPAKDYDYGFCCYDKSFAEKGRVRKGRPLLRTGPMPATAQVAKKIFATRMGVWINRDVAISIGPFDTSLTIGEDTDYACRLLRHGKRGWYCADVGMMIHIHNSTSDQAHFCQSRTVAQAADDILVIATRYPEFSVHLGAKYLRLCAVMKQDAMAHRFIRNQTSRAVQLWLSLFYGAKRLGQSLKRV